MNTSDKVEILYIWVFNYVVSYLTIEEREMVEAVSEQVKDQGIKVQRKKCGQKILNVRSVSAQEAVYGILGLHL